MKGMAWRPFPRPCRALRVLLHLIDGTEEDVAKNYKTIRKELKPMAAASRASGNHRAEQVRCAGCGGDQKENRSAEENQQKPVYEISAVSGKGVDRSWRRLRPRFTNPRNCTPRKA